MCLEMWPRINLLSAWYFSSSLTNCPLTCKYVTQKIVDLLCFQLSSVGHWRWLFRKRFADFNLFLFYSLLYIYHGEWKYSIFSILGGFLWCPRFQVWHFGESGRLCWSFTSRLLILLFILWTAVFGELHGCFDILRARFILT